MSVTMRGSWVKVAQVDDFPKDGGVCAKVRERQIAIFNFDSQQQWYACENQCPHRGDMVLSRGLIGDQGGEPKVACPQHKKTFSLQSGECLSGEDYCIDTFEVKVENYTVFVSVPDER
ncbi:MAG: nitrite reductase small subunit NirD [Gemmatimonadetes bacterium]|nr:nitrite reductase small subunit NirD [Gemmatimonadota bacterium]